jgi:YNFM family putative membrane transporter
VIAAAPRRFPVVLAGFCSFLGFYATQPLLPLLMQEFGASHFAVSLTITAPTIAVAIAAPISGRVADLIGRKRIIVLCAAGLAVATLLASTAQTLSGLIAWRFVQGLLTPGVFGTTIAYIHEEWPASHASRGTGAYVGGTVTGGFFGRALVAVVAERHGWSVAFVVLAGCYVAAALAIAAWMPRESSRTRMEPRRSHSGSLSRLLRNPRLLATDAVGFCALFIQIAIFSYVTFYLSAPPFSVGTQALGWLFATYLMGAVVTPLAGHWVDVRGHRAGIVLAAAVGVAGALATLVPWLPLIVLGLALVGSGVFITQATASSHIGAVTTEDRGLAVGLYSTGYYLGGTLGGSLPALFWDAGGWTACVVLVLAVQITSAVIAHRFWRDSNAHVVPMAEGMA